MGEVLKKFGRYFLLDHIAQGGMAEIYRARLASIDGAGRLLVIKRIQAGFGANSEFLQMFKSEIKVTMGFSHQNIVQLYDFGEEQGQPYIAMEFVDGKNLRQFMSRFVELKQGFPIELAVHIIEQAACGLNYAHSFKDKISGHALNIVHRDISPQNILISFEGGVKVIDFGIAKATTNLESTRAGVIKGKPSYLSPEQISGEQLDGRCDIFALGIVLWELLVGKKLFAGETDLAVLKLIESCQTFVKPPSALNPKVPKELDFIVLRALAKNRDKRFQTAEEMQRALHKFLYSYVPEFNPGDLGYYAKDLFKDEIVEDRKKIQRLNERVEQLLVVDHAPELQGMSLSKEGVRREDTTTVVELKGPRRGLEIPKDPKDGGVEIEAIPRVSSRRQKATGSPSKQATVGPTPRIETSGGGNWLRVAIIVGAGVMGALYWFSSSNDRKIERADKTAEVQGDRGTASWAPSDSAKTIALRLNLIPGGGAPTVTLNGRPVNLANPEIQAPLDAPLELVVERSGFRHFRREFVLNSSQVSGLSEWVMDVQLEPSRYGYLSVHTTPSATMKIIIDGHPWVRKTPLEGEKMPVGTYRVELVNDVLGMEKTVTVTIQEGRAVNIDERLEVKN